MTVYFAQLVWKLAQVQTHNWLLSGHEQFTF